MTRRAEATQALRENPSNLLWTMPWTWEEIEAVWLGGGTAYTPEAVVEAFNRVEATFGREWMEAGRVKS